jgi:2-dehydro-3-deoxyphosphogalactonate aldolase
VVVDEPYRHPLALRTTMTASSNLARFERCFAKVPLVAILRGAHPAEVESLGEALVAAGVTLIEVPLNSPDAFESIGRLARRFGDRAIVGAGTVLVPEEVAGVAEVGGTLIVSPNTNPAVIEATVGLGLIAVPGFLSPSEAFVALGAGAAALKLFPAEASSPAALLAMRAVLPPQARILPVGGINADAMSIWHAAGAAGFGLGSSIYRPGDDAAQVSKRARALVTAWKMTQSV